MRINQNEWTVFVDELKAKIVYPYTIGKSVLDVGYNDATYVLSKLAQKCAKKYIGIDPVPTLRGYASPELGYVTPEKLYKRISVVKTTIEAFATSQKFDVILAYAILEEVNDQQVFLKKTCDLLADDGILFISVPNALSVNRLMGVANGFINTAEDLSLLDCMQGHKRMYTLKTLVEEVVENGFIVEQIYPIGFKPVPLKDMLDLKPYWFQFQNMVEKMVSVRDFCAEILLRCSKSKP